MLASPVSSDDVAVKQTAELSIGNVRADSRTSKLREQRDDNFMTRLSTKLTKGETEAEPLIY